MTEAEVLVRLLSIGALPAGSARVLDASATSISSMEFEDLQDELAQLLVDVANEVAGGPERIAREFPDSFGNRP